MLRSKSVYFLAATFVLGLLALFFVHSEKRVLVIAPSKYDEVLAEKFPYKFYFYHLPLYCNAEQNLPVIIEEICSYARKMEVDGVLSSNDFAGAALSSILCQKLGLVGPTPLSVLTCQHKYYSRLAQRESVPEATPSFSLGPHLPFPCFVKPIRSSFSRYAQRVNSAGEIKIPEAEFFGFFDQLIAYATPFAKDEERILAEGLLQGTQVTWEGFVYDGQVETIGIVDSIMHPGTICFESFKYPSMLPGSVQQRMRAIAAKFLAHVGLNNTVCNIEFMYDEEQDRICIIECNPRMALQFTDLYEKVDGVNSFEIALAIATGSKPRIIKNAGKYQVAASFVLRRFEDCILDKLPTYEEIEKVKTRFPDTLVFIDCKPGQKLSEALQDGVSFRYGLIHLGAKDSEELLARYEECKKALTFTFSQL